MGRPRLYDAALRERLLRRAGEIVSAEGIAGIAVRRLAADVSTSPGAIYALFGSKAELVLALYMQAFESFDASQLLVSPTGDSAADLLELGMAYWDWAIENPHLFRVIFGEALAGFVPEAEQEAMARRTMEPLIGAVARCAAERSLKGDVRLVAFAAWSVVHGAVCLTHSRQNTGSPPEQRARTRVLLEHTWAGWSGARTT